MIKTNYLIVMILISISAIAGDEVFFQRDLSLNANGSKNFFVDVGAGALKIRGGDVDEITVEGKIYSHKYDDIDDLQDDFKKLMVFSLEKNGSKIILKAMVKKRMFSFTSPDINIDLNITIPRRMNVEIDDGSGNLMVSDIDGKLEIDDGSGAMVINNIGDDLQIDDGSGNIEVTDVDGDVHIDDGSGNQIIRNIKGNISIDDGSGLVDIVNVTGDVNIDDGSGSIMVNDLAGSFKLIDDGSGSVHVNGRKWDSD